MFILFPAYLGVHKKNYHLKMVWKLKNVNLTKDKGCLLDLINIEDKK